AMFGFVTSLQLTNDRPPVYSPPLGGSAGSVQVADARQIIDSEIKKRDEFVARFGMGGRPPGKGMGERMIKPAAVVQQNAQGEGLRPIHPLGGNLRGQAQGGLNGF